MTQSSERFSVPPCASVGGKLHVPGDKSISHRALMLAALARGSSRISGFLYGEDCLATLVALRQLGVRIDDNREAQEIVVHGVGMHGLNEPKVALDFGNSGTAMRLMAGILAAQPFSSRLIGDASLMTRPMQRIAEPLTQMGARITTNNGKPPLTISPAQSLSAIDYTQPVASAQVKSALLLAAMFANGTTTVRSPGKSRDHTERMLSAMGASVVADQDTVSLRGPVELAPHDWHVPGDFSSAAFFIVAGMLGAKGALRISNVGVNPTRTGLLDILAAMGGRFELENERQSGAEPVADIVVKRSELRGIDIPQEHIGSAIDEFPVLFVAAAGALGTTRLRGAAELRHKESDRIATMAQALRIIGADVTEYDNGLDITGSKLTGGIVDSCGDHRVAMAMTVASILASEVIEITDTAPVATSFPGFAELAQQAGIDMAVEAGIG